MNQEMSEQIDKKKISTADIQKLLDKVAIKELWYNNCYLIDQGEVDSVMETFTEDAVMNTGAFGNAEGRDAIREMLEELLAEELHFTRHMVHMPLIEIDGDKAIGKWYLDCPSIAGNGEAVWTQGTYKHTFRRKNGEWKIDKFTFEASYVTPYDKGWAKERFIVENNG
ncbi:MAG: nuclear transport factor 2 family protein [Balneolaceae bacterium]|nr:nuclear transport factor 2 family protein [Balneolaceae bacterium]